VSKPKNIHRGSSFTGFLRKEGIYEEVEAAALKKVIAAALIKQMDRRGISVSAFAERLGTSRAAIGRVLGEQNNPCVQRRSPRNSFTFPISLLACCFPNAPRI
jgi:hypothetical protein